MSGESYETTQPATPSTDVDIGVTVPTGKIVDGILQAPHSEDYITFSGAFQFLGEIDPGLINRLGGEAIIRQAFSKGTDEIPYGVFRGFTARWYKIRHGCPELLPPSERTLLRYIHKNLNPDSWVTLPDTISNDHFMIFCDQYTDVEVAPIIKLPGVFEGHNITQNDLCYNVQPGTNIDNILSGIISPILNKYLHINRIFLEVNGCGYIVSRDKINKESQLADFVI